MLKEKRQKREQKQPGRSKRRIPGKYRRGTTGRGSKNDRVKELNSQRTE